MEGLNLSPDFEANLLLAFVAGMIGTVAITLILFAVKKTGHNLDLPYLLGSYFVDISDKTKTYVVGNILNILIGGVWGLIYILTLVAMGVRPVWTAGILWGFAHGIVVGVMMSTITQSHPHMGKGKEISDPGILGSNWSDTMPYIILGIHIIFGVITLYVYQLLFY